MPFRMKIKKLLIANRGEIALRIIGTCRRMGIATVAVYSEADRDSLHVREADEAIAIGGLTPRDSYLQIPKIMKAAGESGADAVHPGYGFLAENAEFARAVIDSGLIWVGPTPRAITLLGDKTAARELAEQANVPFAPGSTGAVATLAEAEAIAARIGFPVLLKAAAGGGGKGMREVYKAEDLPAAFDGARGEAATAFNDERVFIEKFIVDPKHIELQVLADEHGNVLYFPERECSIQRRHQKVIEESPSKAITPAIRAAMGQAAARLVAAAEYTNAGTVEFLLDAGGEFYFMEVNTRLQVEHPVTEMVSGVDLVEQQLNIAAGLELTIKQDELKVNGHAIECRVCVEDVYNDFFPDAGTVQFLDLPQADYIRHESALYAGYVSSMHYDPMVAKLVVWGQDRDQAIARTIDALDRYHLCGLNTTVPFCRAALETDAFKDGSYSTFFVQKYWKPEPPQPVEQLVAAAGVYARAELGNGRKPQFNGRSAWSARGRLA